MNVLLLSMPDTHPYFKPWKIAGPNLALSSIAANTDPEHNVWIADLVLKRRNVKRGLLKALHISNPDIVGISAMTFQFDTAKRIAAVIKSINSDIKTALGGYHGTLMYKKIADNEEGGNFDFIFRQEADLSFNELIRSTVKGNNFETVKGLSFKRGGSFIHNESRGLEDLNIINLPDRKSRIWNSYHALGRPFDIIETSRGCTMDCKFCSIRHMYGRSFRKYEISRVINDIENAKRLGKKSLFFSDDNLTLNVKRFEEICDAIIESGNNDIHYFAQVSSDGIASSERLVDKMEKGGFKGVFLGIENVSERNLKYFQKGDILSKSKKAIQYLKKKHIAICAGLIIGAPEDREEDINKNYGFLKEQDIDTSLDQVVTPYLKTEMRDDLMEKDLITNTNNLKLYNGHFTNIRTKHLSEQELAFLKWKHLHESVNTFTFSGLKVIRRNILKKYYKLFMLRIIPFFMLNKLLLKIRNIGKGEQENFIQSIESDKKYNEFNV